MFFGSFFVSCKTSDGQPRVLFSSVPNGWGIVPHEKQHFFGMATQSCNQTHKHYLAHISFGSSVFGARHENEENAVKRQGTVTITCKKRTDKMQGGMSELSNGFVVLMGLATVFIGLICIILLIMIVSALCRISSSVAPVAQATAGQIERGVLVAVVSAAIAEELGTDVSAIRIVSLQKR